MIFTITFNPSLDYIIHVPSFAEGKINRTDDERILPGGKGINVSTVLSNLGHTSLALGFAAGGTGRLLRSELMKRGIEAEMIEAESGFTRINIKMKGNPETQINGQGPVISAANMEELKNRLFRLTTADTLVVSGSVPACLGRNTYAQIGALTEQCGCRFVVDAEGELLTEALPCHPFLVKPNLSELEQAVGSHLDRAQDILDAARSLRSRGAGNVLVSMGANGALLVTQNDETYLCRAPHVEAVNTVGAGDSAVAGFLSGYMETGSFTRALMTAVAAGSASAASEELAVKADVEKLMRTIHIEKK